jgi:hypothetical protein
MSAALITQALETALNGMSPALATGWPNAPFTPPAATVPYQKAAILFAEPENPTYGNTFHRERGIFQVTLMYPQQTGAAAALARAELIRATFYRGAKFTTTTIERTPEILPGFADGDRWAVPVRIRFYSDIGV